MFVTKCDICKKEIKDRETSVSVGVGRILPNQALCGPCGKPVIAFLKRHGLIDAKVAKVNKPKK